MSLEDKAKENWGSAGPYELYVGRWSRKIAVEFLDWIGVPQKSAWADVGCGTGALTQCILDWCDPRSVAAIDRQTVSSPKRGRPLKIRGSRSALEMQQSCMGEPSVRCRCLGIGSELRAGLA